MAALLSIMEINQLGIVDDLVILPSEEDLKQLCNEKGFDALIWYVWRNALRLLPTLGRVPIEQIWQRDVIQHVFAVSRICLILAQWIKAPDQLATAIDNAAVKANKAHSAVASRDPYAILSRMASMSDGDIKWDAVADFFTYQKNINEVIGYGGVAKNPERNAVRSIIMAAEITNYSDNVNVAIHSIFQDMFVKYSSTEDGAIQAFFAVRVTAAAYDYELLLQQKRLTSDWWYSQPLWDSKSFGRGGEQLSQIIGWQQSFDLELRKIGLDFLADDLNNLWNGRPIGDHARNYLKEFSEVELNDLSDPNILRRLLLGGETVHAVRALLLGPGGAGKSSLADRLQGKPVEYDKKSTVGVDYLNHQPLNLYDTFDYLRQGDKPLDLYLWDFGGQTIFHGLHSAFLHENCVYVLVVDSRHEQAPDEWLYQIRHLAGEQVKVLLVTNWYEKCETCQNETRLRREFPNLLKGECFFYFSCHEPDVPGFQTFVQALEKACLESQRMVLKETLDVNEALQQQYHDDVFLESADLEDIIEQVTSRPESVETLPGKLEQLGFLVRVDSDDQYYCLKPAWAVDNAYAVLYSPLLRKANGVLKLKDLQREFKGEIETRHMTHLVDFLQMRSLCRKLVGGDGYFFPDAAPADELSEASELLGKKSDRLVIRFDLPYLPLGFHASFVNRLFGAHGITNTDDIWRQGFILRKQDSQAVVHYLPRKGMVEMMLVGRWRDFAGLLKTLLEHMKAVLMGGRGISEDQIHPSVVLGKQVVSVYSGEGLVEALSEIEGYNELIKKVSAMASKIYIGRMSVGDRSPVAIGEKINQIYESDSITANK